MSFSLPCCLRLYSVFYIKIYKLFDFTTHSAVQCFCQYCSQIDLTNKTRKTEMSTAAVLYFKWLLQFMRYTSLRFISATVPPEPSDWNRTKARRPIIFHSHLCRPIEIFKIRYHFVSVFRIYVCLSRSGPSEFESAFSEFMCL